MICFLVTSVLKFAFLPYYRRVNVYPFFVFARAANPDTERKILNEAMKRKLLKGIDPNVKGNIFVLHQDPYTATVSPDKILQDCCKAKVHLVTASVKPVPPSETKDLIARVDEQIQLVKALLNLTKALTTHVKDPNEKLHKLEDAKITVPISQN